MLHAVVGGGVHVRLAQYIADMQPRVARGEFKDGPPALPDDVRRCVWGWWWSGGGGVRDRRAVGWDEGVWEVVGGRGLDGWQNRAAKKKKKSWLTALL